MSSSTAISLYQEPSSPSSVSLPPLLDSSPYPLNPNSTTNTLTDRDSCSYDSQTTREHVSCFSTYAAGTASGGFNNFQLAPPHLHSDLQLPALFPRTTPNSGAGVSAFPSLRSLQENIQLPLFFPPATTPYFQGGSVDFSGPCSSTGNWPPAVNVGAEPVGATELDCMWTNYSS